MDGYSYIDIFETKGIEYLVIIAFLLLLIPFSIYMDKRTKVAGAIRHMADSLTGTLAQVSQGHLYSRSHTWARLGANGTARIGLDGFLTGITADMTITTVKNTEETIRKGELLAVIGFDGRRLKIYSPVSGRIIQHNPALNDLKVNSTNGPDHHHWICEMQPMNWHEDTGNLFSPEQASAWFGIELSRLRDFLAARAPQYYPVTTQVILQDGGEMSPQILRQMPMEAWNDFQKEFLDPEEITGQSL